MLRIGEVLNGSPLLRSEKELGVLENGAGTIQAGKSR